MTKRLFLLIAFVAGSLATAAPADAAAFVHVRSRAKELAPGALAVPQRVLCPSGTVVVGGGATVSGATGVTALVASAPFDSRDRGTRPDDGWKAAASNNSSEPQKLRTYAVCAKTGSYRFIVEQVVAPPRGRTAAAAACPEGTNVIGGGGAITGVHSSIELAESHPNNLDADPEPAEGWNVGFNNETSHHLAIGVWAICTTSRLYYNPGSFQQANNANGHYAGSCGANQFVYGGGGDVKSTDPAVFLQATWPYSSTLWGVRFSNSTGSPVEIEAWRICRGER